MKEDKINFGPHKGESKWIWFILKIMIYTEIFFGQLLVFGFTSMLYMVNKQYINQISLVEMNHIEMEKFTLQKY